MQHPTSDELRAFLDGGVGSQRAEQIIAHLDNCQACEQKIQVLEEAGCEFAGPLQKNNQPLPYTQEEACHHAISQAKQIANEAIAATDANTDNCIDETLIIGAQDSQREPITDKTTLIENLETHGSEPSDQVDGSFPYLTDYEILHEIARGGMGIVFKARQRSLGRIVALKMIKAGTLADSEDVKRFYAEAQAAANLEHPHIVPVFEVGAHDGQHFFAMGFIEGQSLADRIVEGVLPPREAAAVVKSISEAIAFAHSRGIVHRDLKPANVLLAPGKDPQAHRDSDSDKPSGRLSGNSGWKSSPSQTVLPYTPKVTDFGLAKRMDQDDGMTATGQIMGTPAYMPPEQASGRTGEIGETADVYSLGGILYCTLIGRPPFQAANVIDTIQQVMQHEPVSPRRIDRTIPVDLETICLKCLEKDPARRYQTARELASDLDCFLQNREVSARPVGQTGRLVRWSRRNPMIASLVSLVLLTLVAGVCISSLFAVQATYEAGEARKSSAIAMAQTAVAEEARQGAVAARGRAENARKQAVSDREKAKAAQKTAEQAKAAADASRKRAEAAEKRAKQEASGHWRALGQTRIALASSHYQNGNMVDMDRELRRVPKLLRDALWRYLNRRADPSIATRTYPNAAALRFAAAIPGSKGRFVVSGDDGAFVMNGLNCKYEGQLFHPDGTAPNNLYPNTVSPDGKLFLGINRRSYRLEVYNLATRKRIVTWELPERPPLLFGPGNRFYAASGSGAEERDVMTGRVLAKRPGFILFTIAPQTGLLIGSEKNQLLALKSLEGPVVWRAEDVASSHRVHGDCSPDGQFVTLLHEGQRTRTYRAGVEGPEVRTPLYSVAAPESQFSRVIYSRRGRSFMTVGRDQVSATIRIWDRDSGLLTHSLLGLARSAQEPAYDPQTGLLLIPYGQGVKTWRPNIDVEEKLFPGGGVNFAFASDKHIWRTVDSEKGIVKVTIDSPEKVLFRPSQHCRRIALSRDRNTALLDQTVSGLMLVTDGANKTTGKSIGYHRTTCGLAVSPSGAYAAAIENKGRASVFDAVKTQGVLEKHFGIVGKQDEGNHVVFTGDSRFIGLRPIAPHSIHRLISCSVDGKNCQEKQLDFMVHCAAASPDGSMFAVGCGDRNVRVYDSKTLELVRPPFRVHDQKITAICFHPHLPMLATASSDFSVRLWDSASAEQVGEFLGFSSAPRSLDFTPSGKQLGALATHLRIWNIEPMTTGVRTQQSAKERPPN